LVNFEFFKEIDRNFKNLGEFGGITDEGKVSDGLRS
jgi:hypothetical protein